MRAMAVVAPAEADSYLPRLIRRERTSPNRMKTLLSATRLIRTTGVHLHTFTLTKAISAGAIFLAEGEVVAVGANSVVMFHFGGMSPDGFYRDASADAAFIRGKLACGFPFVTKHIPAKYRQMIVRGNHFLSQYDMLSYRIATHAVAADGSLEAEPKGTYSNSKATADALTAAE